MIYTTHIHIYNTYVIYICNEHKNTKALNTKHVYAYVHCIYTYTLYIKLHNLNIKNV